MNDEKTAENLRRMIRLVRDSGAEVVLVGVPRPSLFLDEGADFYAEVANELGVPYEATALAEILGSSKTKSDLVHANAAGYRILAERIAGLLRESGAITR